MPGANEVFGCPPSLQKSFCQLISKNSDDLLLVIYPNLYLRFCTSFWIPPYPGCAGPSLLFLFIFKHLSLFLNIYLHFLSANSLVGCPPAECPGRRTPAPPSARH